VVHDPVKGRIVHDIAEILLKVALKYQKSKNQSNLLARMVETYSGCKSIGKHINLITT
jgi:hypothetical protein